MSEITDELLADARERMGKSVESTNAEFIEEISHREALERGLKVMDSTALSLCMDNKLPIYVFNMNDESNIDRIISGERVGTLVTTA